MTAKQIVLIIHNPMLQRRVAMVAKAADLVPVEVLSVAALNPDVPPTAIILELELPGAIEAISTWKAQWPDCFIAAAISIPDQELWLAANAAGCDLVANRGALPYQLPQRLKAHQSGSGLSKQRQRLQAKRITNPSDGLVGRIPDAPDGAIAIFRVGNKLCAIRDVCPHAGYSLADGELNGTVITCPQHGSRFDICTGERIRGPSDYPVQTYGVVAEGNNLFVEV